jgi:anti-sigma factor RsiW
VNPNDAYRDHLDRCLDARIDPLDDPALRELLERHPELLDRFARTREDLRLLVTPAAAGDRSTGPAADAAAGHAGPSAGPAAGRPGRWRRAAAIGAVAGVAAGLCAWALLTTPAPEPAPRPPRILSADLVEIAPRLNASTTVTVHEPLMRTERIVLETYERRSLTR